MISLVSNSYAAASALRSSRAASPAASFSTTMAEASTATAASDTAIISDAAKAKSADPMAKYYGEVPIEASPANVAEWRAAAAAVSKAQGLPDGQYDFSRMDSKQLIAVINDYTGKGVSQSRLNGLLTTASQLAWNEDARAAHGVAGKDTIDVTAWLHDMYSADVRSGGVGGREALFTKGSLDLVDEMTKVVGSKGRASAASTDSETTDSVAKLNDAIAAFKKEASLTPAQRARRDVLKTMNLTEDAIKAMTPEQQKVTEQKIADEVARRLGNNRNSHAGASDADAATTAPLALGA